MVLDQLRRETVLEAVAAEAAPVLNFAELRSRFEILLGRRGDPAETASRFAVAGLVGYPAGAAVFECGVALALYLAFETFGLHLAVWCIVEAGYLGGVAVVVDRCDEVFDAGVDADGVVFGRWQLLGVGVEDEAHV